MVSSATAAPAAGISAVRWELSAAPTLGGSSSFGLPHTSSAGSAWFLGAAIPLRRWFSLGVEAGRYRSNAYTTYDEFSGEVVAHDGSDWMTVSIVSRMSVPVQGPLSPFIAFETGVSRLRQSEGYFVGYANPNQWNVEWSMCSSIGMGLRGNWARPWPVLQAEGRLAALNTVSGAALVSMPRIMLSY